MANYRSNLSDKNPYFLPSHRTLELKHFCLQYKDWLESYSKLRLYPEQNYTQSKMDKNFVDRTAEQAIRLKHYKDKIDMINQAAEDTDEDLKYYILRSVTEEKSYDWLKLHCGIPCCRDVFYQQKRRFWWILSQYRD